MEPTVRYRISIGDRGVMYTLRGTYAVHTQHGSYDRDDYVKTLSSDPVEAQRKAKEYTGQDLPIPDIDLKNRADARAIDWTVFQFGKYQGRAIADVYKEDPKYVVWVAEDYSSKSVQKNIEIARQIAAADVAELTEKRRMEAECEDERKRKIAEKRANSQYVGTIGKKIEMNVTVNKIIPIYGSYGQTDLHLMEDENGNAFAWFCSGYGFNENETLKIKGTVKDFREYEGQKQTVLTRVKEAK